jgi:hypothetical protein
VGTESKGKIMSKVKTPDRVAAVGVCRSVDGLVGRDLDRAIAEEVMCVKKPDPLDGDAVRYWSTVAIQGGAWFWDYREDISGTWQPFFFSSEIAAAMDVLEKFQSQGWGVTLNAPIGGGGWSCDLRPPQASDIESDAYPTLPEAICRAALAARQNEEK